jgi:hypothetical protein
VKSECFHEVHNKAGGVGIHIDPSIHRSVCFKSSFQRIIFSDRISYNDSNTKCDAKKLKLYNRAFLLHFRMNLI